MGNKTFGEMPPHWFADQIEDAVASGDVSKIKAAVCDIVNSDDRIDSAIREGLKDPPPGIVGAGTAHRIREAIAAVIGEY